MKNVFSSYDQILIVSSWGLPKEYEKARYVLEVVKERRREVIPRDSEVRKFTSTAAIKEIVEKEIGVGKVKPLIFVQDTILLPRIVENKAKYVDKSIKREDLENILLTELYNSNPSVARELGVSSPSEYKGIIRFVPGVISYVDGPLIITWRREHVYDLLRGIITLYLYEELVNAKDRRIAVILDTTHGINYFAVALKEATLLASELYALSGKNSSLEELTIYHYNSDPIPKGVRGEASLKLHLLDILPVVKDRKLSSFYTLMLFESTATLNGIRGLEKKLENFWAGALWNKIAEALLLFSRGLLVWALKLSIDIDSEKILREDELSSAAKNIDVVFKKERRSIKISYDWGKEAPTIHVTVFAILFNILRNYANRVLVSGNIVENTWKELKRLENILKKVKGSNLERIMKEIKEILNSKSEFKCFDLDEIASIMHKMYKPPQNEINKYEIKDNIEKYLAEEEPGWKPIYPSEELKIYQEPRDRAYFVVHGTTRLLISPRDVHTRSRDIYAHAGLAYGLKWFATINNNAKPVLCLGEENLRSKLI